MEGRVEGYWILWGVKEALGGDDGVDEDYGGMAGGVEFRKFSRGGVG